MVDFIDSDRKVKLKEKNGNVTAPYKRVYTKEKKLSLAAICTIQLIRVRT